jgi:hypothetical protein
MLFIRISVNCWVYQYKSAARFCGQVAAWVSDMFGNFYFMKSHKLPITQHKWNEARKKISTDLESLEYLKFFNVGLTKFEN